MKEKMTSMKDIKLVDMTSIPDLGLYMDQVVQFLDQSLYFFKTDINTSVLTKTMINNYVKHKVLPKPHQKKYRRDHIMRLMMIYILKNTFAMEEINAFFKQGLQQYLTVDALYIAFSHTFNTLWETGSLNNQEKTSYTNAIHTLELAILSDYYKRLACFQMLKS